MKRKQKHFSLITDDKSQVVQRYKCGIFFARSNTTIMSQYLSVWVISAKVSSNSSFTDTSGKVVAKLRKSKGLHLSCGQINIDGASYRWLKNSKRFRTGLHSLAIRVNNYSLGEYKCQIRINNQIMTSEAIYIEYADPCEDEKHCHQKPLRTDCYSTIHAANECPTLCKLCENLDQHHQQQQQ